MNEKEFRNVIDFLFKSKNELNKSGMEVAGDKGEGEQRELVILMSKFLRSKLINKQSVCKYIQRS